MMNGSLVLILVLSALLFGAVETWAMAIIGTITALVFIASVVRTGEIVRNDRDTKRLMLGLAAILGYGLFQLIPLPLSLTGFFHPALKDFVTLSPAGPPTFNALTVYPFATEMELARITVYLMVFSLVAFGQRDKDGLLTLAKALSLFGFLLALFGLLQHGASNGKIYWLRELTQGGSPFGPFVNKNHFAGFIGMIIPLSLGIALSSGRTEQKVIFIFFSVIMAVALFFSLSRGGIISFFAAVAVFSFYLLGGNRARKSIITLFLFFVLIGAYLLFLGIGPIIERFSDDGLLDTSRLLANKGTLAAIRDFSIFGSGLGSFEYVYKTYQPDGFYAYLNKDFYKF
ncbi:MAG: hypothetical protein HGA78_09565 [Nitrospirales bacterium]|nr:hypothetical protein [Nitrospirales bacterium]